MLWAGGDAQNFSRRERFERFGIDLALAKWFGCGADTQHVAAVQRPFGETAQTTEDMRGGAAEKRLDRDAALHAQVAARPRARRAKAQSSTGRHLKRLPQCDVRPVERRPEVGTAQSDDGGVSETERATEERHLERGCIFEIAEEAIADSQRNGVGGAGRRDAHRSETFAAQVLYGCEQTRLNHFDGVRAFWQFSNRSSDVRESLA